ncbi:MAG: peptidylprolyl isomerase [Planctomycetota bacterium]
MIILHRPFLTLCLGIAVVCASCHGVVVADEKYQPSDPIAAIDGDPIYLGELNLILTERFKVRDLRTVEMEVQQVTAALLVRRHLAMKSLRAQGGAALESMTQRTIETFASEATRRGSSMEQQAKARGATEDSLRADLAWRTAWAQYLKSKLTDANLRRFFDQRRLQYAGYRWEVSQIFLDMDINDRSALANAKQILGDLVNEMKESDDLAQAFAQAASQHSDAGSAGEGGKIGWVEKDGDLPGSVMALIRKTKVGEIGGPIRSPLGLHLIYVHQAKPGELKYEQLTDQSQLRRDAADALFDHLVNQQREANIQWFIPALRPPEEVPIFPESSR